MKHSRYLLFFLALAVAGCGGPTYRTRVIEPPASSATPAHPGKPGLKPWEKPYEVNGERYQPMSRDAHFGYVEEGLASWYGKDFHGRRTSNGEIYDMYARTAAHKTLPLGVTVKVRNLANGKETTARINDRGPFVRNRIIDLSYTLAKDLDVVGPGTAPVRIEAIGFQEMDAAGKVTWRQPKSYSVESYAVQVGSFGVRENADRLAAQLRSRYGAASVQEGRVDDKLFYRVRVGKYPNLEAAEAARGNFETNGYPNSFVVAMD